MHIGIDTSRFAPNSPTSKLALRVRADTDLDQPRLYRIQALFALPVGDVCGTSIFEARRSVVTSAQADSSSIPTDVTLGWWFAGTALAFLCFAPALTTTFGIGHDFYRWNSPKPEAWFSFAETWQRLAEGRPLGALLTSLQVWGIRTIDDLLIWRWISLATTILCAWLCASYLHYQMSIRAAWSASIAACVFLLPASQLSIVEVTRWVSGPCTVLLSIVAYSLLNARNTGIAHAPTSRRRILAASTVLQAALVISPSSALFSVVLSVAHLFSGRREDWTTTRERVLRDLAFFTGNLVTTWLLARLILIPVSMWIWPSVVGIVERQQADISPSAAMFDLLRLWRQGCDILCSALAAPLATMGPAWSSAFALISLLLVGIAFVWRLRDFADWRQHAGEVLVSATLLILLSAAPALFATGSSATNFQSIFPVAAIAVLGCAAALMRVARSPLIPQRLRLNQIVPCACVAMSAALAIGNLQVTVSSAATQLKLARGELARVDLPTVRTLIVVSPAKNSVRPQLRDFSLAGHQDLLPPGFLNLLLDERAVRRRSIPVIQVRADEELPFVNEGTAAINLTGSRTAMASKSMETPQVRVRASSALELVTGAVDANEQTFWETQEYPQWLDFNFPAPRLLAEYSLQFGRPDRAATEWQLLGSNDGRTWNLIDGRSQQAKYLPATVHRLKLVRPVTYRNYRLLFTAGSPDIDALSDNGGLAFLRVHEVKLLRYQPTPRALATRPQPAAR